MDPTPTPTPTATTPEQLPRDQCSTCRKPIIWAMHERTRRRMPIDAWPSAEGNVRLVRMPVTDEYLLVDGYPVARVLTTKQRFGQTTLHTSHFATCPQAATHRRGRERS
jgi:hypothetical protein